MSNIVAIVGRPNVGKSTFFNRLTQTRSAIVDETSGVTRDRHYGKAEWAGKKFYVIDTGGYATNSDDVFEEAIRKQVLIAIKEADCIVFMLDVTAGITDYDEQLADILRRTKKKVFVVANKVDNYDRIADAAIFYSFGLGDNVYPLSSISGSGTGELLDDIVANLTKQEIETDESALPRIAIVGKPNVGKSSILNALIGQEKHIVTPIAGTTRDAIDTHYNAFGKEVILVDTAGLRKKGKVEENLEFYSVMRSIRAIENADVCLLVIDAQLGIEAQDMNIFSLIIKNKKGVVIVVNKWDLIEKETNTSEQFKKQILSKIAPFTDVPIFFVSAVTKQRLLKVLEAATRVYENRKKRIPTRQLNDTLLPLIAAYPPPAVKGKLIKIKYVTQLPKHAPGFVFFANLPQYIQMPYKRYLENKIRENFDFTGVPISIFIRKK